MSNGHYLDSDTDPKKRLQWVLGGGWTTSSPAYANLGLFLDSGDAMGFNTDADDMGGEFRTAGYLFSLYNKYVQNDLQTLVKLYSVYKYPSTTNITDQYKKDILINFYEKNPSFGDESIGDAILIKYKGNKRGDFFSDNAIKTFTTDILNGSKTVSDDEAAIEKLINEYGFYKWISNQDSGGDVRNKIYGLGAFNSVTSADLAQLNTIKAAVRKVQGLQPAKELTRGDEVNVNQCALISDLLHRGYSYKGYPKMWNRGNDGDNKAFNGRIYPVTLEGFNPDNLINMCTIPKTIKTFFDQTTNVNSVVWALDWIYSDKEGIKQEPIFKTNKSKTNSPFIDKTNALASKGFLPKKDALAIVDNINKEKKGYTISGVTVSYEGTNPSTARNDVKVDLTIKLDSLLALKAVCCYVALKTDDDNDPATKTVDERVEIKISDLVGATQSNRYETQTIATTPFSREFAPDFSRIRLKVSTNHSDLDGSDLLVNLATIKHEITTPAADGKTTLTITYRGYFEQAMNMPYNDALADDDLITNRIRRNEKIKEARQKKCSDKLIRGIAAINQEEERIEIESFHAKGGLIKRIYDKEMLYQYALDDTSLAIGLNGNILDPRISYVKNFKRVYNTTVTQAVVQGDPFGTTRRVDSNLARLEQRAQDKTQEADGFLENVDVYLQNKIIGEASRKVLASMNVGLDAESVFALEEGRCFFLGDLMDLLLDCLYETDKAEHRPHAKGMNLRFIVGTIRVPDPQNLDKYMTINPLQIPLDMAFFASWYHDTIVKKGITHYPVGVFIKDLLERLINDVIFDTCFTVLLPDERPPQLRTTFFTDCDSKNRWFKTYNILNSSYGLAYTTSRVPGEWFDPLDPYDKSPYRSTARKPNILMKKDASVDIAKCKNYCVIYQQSPSYFRQLKNQKKGDLLRNDPYCPTLLYGYNLLNHQYLQSPTLTKSNATYLKEARFFSSQLGTLSLMSNIYDVSFEIAEKKINTMFYPGNIINLIITDFDGGSSHRWSSLSLAKSSIDESNPHKAKTLANTLGIGGYHIIKSVSYTLTNKATKNIVVSIGTKFAGTDALGDQDVSGPSTPYADEPANCITQYNEAIERLEKTEEDLKIDAADFDRILEGGVAATTTMVTTSGQTERASLNAGVSANVLDGTDPRVQAAIQKKADEEADKISAAGTPQAAIQNSHSHNMVGQFSKGTVLQGSRFDAVLFKDKVLRVKTDPKPNKAGTETRITWSVGTVGTGGFVEEQTYTVIHTN